MTAGKRANKAPEPTSTSVMPRATLSFFGIEAADCASESGTSHARCGRGSSLTLAKSPDSFSMLSIGFVSAAAVFRSSLSRKALEAALRGVELELKGEEPVLRDDLSAQYGSLCDFALKRVINQNASRLRTLHVESGYGWAEYHKDWYQLGSEFVVDETEFDEAFSFLNDPTVAGALDALLEDVTEEFIERHLPADMFEDFSCSFYVQQKPEKPG